MRKRFLRIAAFVVAGSYLLLAQQDAPVFYFGGEGLNIGMAKSQAVARLATCCKLTPPVDEERPIAGKMVGHFIQPKEESPEHPILGTIYFSGGRVARMSRDLAGNVDTENTDLVSFMRAFRRALPDGTTSAVITLQHEKNVSNAEVDELTIVLPSGKGIEIHIGTLDTPNNGNRRDFVTLDETLEAHK